MSDPSDRLERAIAQLGAEHEPPPGWEAKVLAAIESPRAAAPERRPWLRRWWPAIPTAVLAAAVLVLVLRPTRPEALKLVVATRAGDPSRGAMRGGDQLDDVPLGNLIDISVRGGEHRAVWVYRDSARLVAACPRDASCETADGALRLVWKVDQIGRYQVVALTGSQALPEPTGDYERDLAALVHGNIDNQTREFQVR